MLVVTRKTGQRVFIGPDIVLTFVEIERGRVRVGIEAPKEVAIYREEIAPRDMDRPRGE